MRYSVSLRIQSECGKILVRKNSDTFYEVRNLFFRHCKKKKRKKEKRKENVRVRCVFFPVFKKYLFHRQRRIQNLVKDLRLYFRENS